MVRLPSGNPSGCGGLICVPFPEVFDLRLPSGNPSGCGGLICVPFPEVFDLRLPFGNPPDCGLGVEDLAGRTDIML
jgi:hypothetical protein